MSLIEPGDREMLAVELQDLADVFGIRLSDARVDAYFRAMQGLDLADVVATLRRAAEELDRFPYPVTIRKMTWERSEARKRSEDKPTPWTQQDAEKATKHMIDFALQYPGIAIMLWGGQEGNYLPTTGGMICTRDIARMRIDEK